ncbi:MAG TPA: SWIM zinc finger family protein, partial [Candidatus Competibacteraceae bacterium]|nr:SWIM zinc finger family protein [Candidatus Competibacteraceae bacterium]
MPFPALSRTIIRQQAGEASFQKGLAYYQQGAVVSLVKRGDNVQAEVEGSEYTPYRVRIGLDAGGINSAECSCPYDWGGWCKHIVAALLACLEHPDTVEERPPLQEQLAALNREELQFLLLKLAEQEPDLIERIEAQLALFQAGATVSTESFSAKASGRRTPIDPKPFRRQVQAAIHSLDRLRSSEAYHQVGSVVGEVRQLLRQAQDFIEGGDSDNALRILEAITDEYAEEWFNMDDSDGKASDFFQELDPVWAEALL